MLKVASTSPVGSLCTNLNDDYAIVQYVYGNRRRFQFLILGADRAVYIF